MTDVKYAERERFEAWVLKDGTNPNALEQDEIGYAVPVVAACWEAWEASADATCALRRAQKESGWRPIAEAPQGTIVLMCDLQAQDVAGFMYVDWVVDGKCCGNRHRTPTHWQPLPSPPTPEGASK